MDKRKNNGITLVSLVVTIIIMLILAGVSINAAIGENGIVTRAAEASRQSKIASEKENLEYALTNLNVGTVLDDDEVLMKDVAIDLKNKGLLDSTINLSSGQPRVFRDDSKHTRYFCGTKGENSYKISKNLDNQMYSVELITGDAGGGDVSGYTVVTQENFNTGSDVSADDKGKYKITSNAEVVFMDSISGELSILVESGVHATVGVYADITLTNENVEPKRSAVEIKSSGVLDLYIGEKEDGTPATLTVNSGFGGTAPVNTGSGAEGGNGGHAGIHVPADATLNIHGIGNVIAIGGDAGDGGTAVSNNAGGGGGGGAGAGIGGNGGKGGNSNRPLSGTDKYAWSATDGIPGEDCGTVNIFDTVTIYAYGGAGGSGGVYTAQTGSSGTGGGGYPAAGIGGGGAGGGGGDHMNGGGGYSAGLGEQCSNNTVITNGYFYNEPSKYSLHATGGSYYCSGKYDRTNGTYIASKIGGQGGHDHSTTDLWFLDQGGDGGVAGKGGIVNVNKTNSSNKAMVYAYNGNMVTDNDYSSVYEFDKDGNQVRQLSSITSNGITFIPAIIYAQDGILRNVYKLNCWWDRKLNTNYDYFFSIFGDTLNDGVDEIVCPRNEVNWSTIRNNGTAGEWIGLYDNYLIRSEIIEENDVNSIKNGYINPQTNSRQGIGSGAGYIELSNGEYNEYVEDNNGSFIIP